MPRTKSNACPHQGHPVSLKDAQAMLQIRLRPGGIASMLCGSGAFYDPVSGRWISVAETEGKRVEARRGKANG